MGACNSVKIMPLNDRKEAWVDVCHHQEESTDSSNQDWFHVVRAMTPQLNPCKPDVGLDDDALELTI